MPAPKGYRPPNAGKGRPKGAANTMTRTLREMILGALDDAGGQDYLAEQAHKNLQLSWRCSARCSRGTFTQVEDSGSDFGANATVWGLATHPPTPTALWRLAGSVRCTSPRMPARPGARSRVNSARSGPQSGCRTRAPFDQVRSPPMMRPSSPAPPPAGGEGEISRTCWRFDVSGHCSNLLSSRSRMKT